jgi:hypothetical protein
VRTSKNKLLNKNRRDKNTSGGFSVLTYLDQLRERAAALFIASATY